MTGPSVPRRPLLLVLALALLGATACTEELTTSNTCSGGLCPEQGLDVLQLELQPVTEDTTIRGIPLRGTETLLLAARAGDSLDTRVIYRFDSLPRFWRNASAESLAVEAVHAPVIEVLIARRAQSYVPAPVTLEAFDVDIAGNDTSTAQLAAAFTPARRLSSVTVQPRAAADTTSTDTLRFALDPATLLRKIRTDSVLRVGVRVTSPGDARLLLAPAAVRLSFRPAADTTVARLAVGPRSNTPPGQTQLQIDLSAFSIVVAGTRPPATTTVAVGGLPGQRALLRFAIPPAIVDSSTVLRATLVLTQRPLRGYLASDTLRLQPLAVTTSEPVRDVARRALLASNALSPFTGRRVLTTTPLLLVPSDSGRVELTIAELVGAWRTQNNLGFLPELVLASVNEGMSPVQVEFFSSEAPAEVRPKLRISYVRRINFLLP